MMKNFKKYIAFASVMMLFACNNTSTTSVETKDSTATVAKKTSPPIRFTAEKLDTVYTGYLALKNALVATKFEEAKAAAAALAENLTNANVMGAILASANTISAAPDIAAQRKEFTNLSNNMIALFKKSTLTSGTLFLQHCPMANNGDGGDWLASEQKIQNPYYGSEMMECGAVIEEIKSK